MELLLIILAFVELIIAVFSSVTRCTVGAWCVDFLLPYCSPTDPQYCQVIENITHHRPSVIKPFCHYLL